MTSHARIASLVAILSCALGVPPAASALPEALDKIEIGCQSALSKALAKYGKARTGCEASCQKKTPKQTTISATVTTGNREVGLLSFSGSTGPAKTR